MLLSAAASCVAATCLELNDCLTDFFPRFTAWIPPSDLCALVANLRCAFDALLAVFDEEIWTASHCLHC